MTPAEHHGDGRRAGWASLALGVCFVVLYACTLPYNHADAEDALMYAWRVESRPAHTLLHGRHLIYEPLMATLHGTVQRVAPSVRAYPVLVAASIVSGGLLVATLFLLLYRRLRYPGEFAFFAAALCGVLYGVWRYAGEAEVYAPAMAAALVAVYLLSADTLTVRRRIAAGAAGAIAVGLHVAMILPMLVAPIAYLVWRGLRTRRILVYVGALLTPVAGAYALTGIAPMGGAGWRTLAAFQDTGIAALPRLLLKGMIGLGQTLAAQEYLFCLPGVRSLARRIFPTRMLDEELFMGTVAGWPAAVLPLITMSALAALVAVILIGMLRRRSGPTPGAPVPTALARKRRALKRCFMLWAMLHAITAWLAEPGNPEAWVLTTVPLVLGLCLGVLADRWQQRPAVTALVLPLLALHNYVGGQLLLSIKDADFNAVKGRWLVEHSQPADVVLTAANPVFVRYLTYHAPGRVADLYTLDPDTIPSILARADNRGFRVYATADVFAGHPVMRQRDPARHDAILRAMYPLRHRFRPVATSPLGPTLILVPPPAP